MESIVSQEPLPARGITLVAVTRVALLGFAAIVAISALSLVALAMTGWAPPIDSVSPGWISTTWVPAEILPTINRLSTQPVCGQMGSACDGTQTDVAIGVVPYSIRALSLVGLLIEVAGGIIAIGYAQRLLKVLRKGTLFARDQSRYVARMAGALLAGTLGRSILQAVAGWQTSSWIDAFIDAQGSDVSVSYGVNAIYFNAPLVLVGLFFACFSYVRLVVSAPDSRPGQIESDKPVTFDPTRPT